MPPLPPPPKKKFRRKAQCSEIPYKSSYSEMLAYLDNQVGEIGGEMWWRGEERG